MRKYILFVSAMLFSVASFSQTSWLYPAATGETYNTWNDPTNAYANDGARAMLLYSNMPGSQDYYNFSIPDMTGNTITGIEVRGEIYHNNSAGYTTIQIELSWDDGATWTSSGYSAVTSSLWTEEAFAVGGQYSTWGRTWNASNFTNSNFKVRLTFVNDGGSWYSELDYVQVRIYYGGGGSPTPSDTLYFDPVAVGSTQAGTEANPIVFGATLENAIEAADPGTVFMMADTTYYGFLLINGANGSSGSPIKLTTWNKYTTSGKFKITGYKEITGFTQVGNNWRKTDTDLPNTYRTSGGGLYTGYIAMRNFLLINGTPYAPSRYPNTGYLQAESWSTANPSTYIYDNTPLNDNYDGAIVNMTDEEWGIMRAKADVSGNTINLQSGYSSNDLGNLSTFNAIGSNTLKYFLSNLEYLSDANGDYAYNPETQQLSVFYTGDLNTQTVKYSTLDILLRMDDCNYITLDNIEFEGGVVAHAYFEGGGNIVVKNCKFLLSPGWAGLLIEDVNTVLVDSNSFTDGANTALSIRSRYTAAGSQGCSDVTVTNNVFKRYGVYDQMILDGFDVSAHAAHIFNTVGTIYFAGNYIDSTGYSGLSTTTYNEGVTSIIEENNIYLHTNLKLNDGSASYHYENANLSNYERIIRKNYINDVRGNGGFSYHDVPAAFGIYLDGGSNYWTIDSNVVIYANAGINLNGTDNNTVSHNILYNNRSRPDRGGGIKAQEYGHFGPTTDCDFNNNIIIMRDSTYEHGILWVDTDASLNPNGTISDYNKFFNPFIDGGYVGATLANWGGTTTRRTLSGMYSSLGFEQHSTYNSPDWTFQDVTGITRDQFTKIFFNASSSPHYFRLGTASFRDLSTSAVVIDSFELDPYEYRALFYNSGSLVGVDDPLYIGESAPNPAPVIYSATHYVSTSGSDANPGTYSQPWATWGKAFSEAVAGDTIYIRGGVYYPTSTYETMATNQDGTESQPVFISSYPGETAILDGTNVTIDDYNFGVYVINSDYWHLKDLEIRNFKDGSTSYIARGIDFNGGANVTLENLVVHGNGGDGMVIRNVSSGTGNIINCDSYNNADVYYNGESADGLEIFSNTSSANFNVKGCRFWGNSDDGLDFFDSEGIAVVDSCWSFSNGSGTAGDGNGFKLGRATTDLGVTQRTVRNCISADNLANAFDQNEGDVEMVLYNNLAYDNGVGYVFDQGTNPITIKNCASLNSGLNWFNGYVTEEYNSWSGGVSISSDDFSSLSVSLLSSSRDGKKLPIIQFGRLVSGSDLIDAGTNVGLPYLGVNSDIGAFEYLSEVSPNYTLYGEIGINFTNASFLKYDWNNLTSSTGGTTLALDYFGGTPSGITLTSEDTWGFGVGSNGYYPGIFPDSVQRTNFIADDGLWKDLIFSGLKPNHYYSFQVLGSRINNGDTRRTVYKIGNDSILVTVTDNANVLAEFDYVQPTSGTITLSCRRNLGAYAYINGIKIVEYVLPTQATVKRVNNRVILIRYF